MPYICLYLNKGNNSSVKRSILTKLIGYQESMVLIICTKNELNLTNRYWDMNPDGRNGMDGRTDNAKTISLQLRRGIKNHKPTWPSTGYSQGQATKNGFPFQDHSWEITQIGSKEELPFLHVTHCLDRIYIYLPNIIKVSQRGLKLLSAQGFFH